MSGKRETQIALFVLFIVLIMPCVVSAAGDPTGAKTLSENPESPVDYVWVLVAAFLVMFMQPGFAMLEAGLSRAKHECADEKSY